MHRVTLQIASCPQPFRVIRTLGVAVLAGLGWSGAATSVQADDTATQWIRFPGQTYQSAPSGETYDRNFMKQWEASPPKGFPTLSPDNINAMKAAIKRYQDVVANGGFPAVPPPDKSEQRNFKMTLGLLSPVVAIVKQRLALSGDLREAENDGSTNFDYALEKAVKRFQASNGLTPTGVIDDRTIAALNVPAQSRLKQLQTNLARITELAKTAGKKYIVVNIPAAQIEAVENDKVVSRHAGVVGKLDRQTPILNSQIHQLNFNPVWHLPPTVISQDLIPKGMDMQRRGQDVLAKYGIDAYGADGRKVESSRVNWSLARATGYSFKQQPGPENPLGFVKINFHNNHSVYMHSTPSDTLFTKNFRAASSGCVRIAGIEQLAGWLLADQGWSAEKVSCDEEVG